jgi:hypothetical protein
MEGAAARALGWGGVQGAAATWPGAHAGTGADLVEVGRRERWKLCRGLA